ncbi:MAG: HsdR family type I site-specific deoxyribonuclease [Gammaproteobacteria bacterium]|nr:MAG: HsdR family type I site-specific deoxyribonuclease [Gammaproteobacteria bacterium]
MKFSETQTVQAPFIRYAEEVEWAYLTRSEALRLRGGEGGLFLRQVFTDKLQALNPHVDLARAEEIAGRLARLPASIEGNFQAFEYLKGLKTVFVPEKKLERNVRFLDEDWRRNTFHVTDELSYTNGLHTIRLDGAFFVNGFPVLLLETKAAHKEAGIAEALVQVRRYHEEGPELLTLMQLFALTHLIRFYYGPTWNTGHKALLNWREEAAGDFETLVKAFIHPERITRILRDFLIFTRRDGALDKVVLRPHQMRAVDKSLQRAKDPERRRGLIWHTQGSGKTFTMITLAQKLLEHPLFEHPTVIMAVDRNELEQQLFSNLSALGLGEAEVAQSKRHLQELLRSDRRGLIVTTLHKFDDMPANVLTRHNVFVLIDEAHRTTGGDLGTYLMAALPNATLFGFTGTPIDKSARGKSTFQLFGINDPSGYLDKYSIRESIEEGTTVPLHYTLAPNELRVDRETLEQEFLSLKEVEGIADPEALDRILDKAVTLKNMLKSPERIEHIAGYVAEHYRDYVEPLGYKAFLVGVDREACALYKAALDKHLPPEASRVVISPSHKDSELLKRYHLTEEEERQVRRDFRDKENPKFLIVTEKLLTGFDAPILYAMYLDKPMRDHVLLQAIARVNRPYEDERGQRKKAGLVIDFVGIFDHLERALAFDSKDVAQVVTDLKVLEEDFARRMEQARQDYLPLAQGGGDKAIERILSHFLDEKARHAFYRFFRELADLYEILSPSSFLHPYLDDYDTLARMMRIVKNAYDPGPFIDPALFRKTEKLVQAHTHAGAIQDALQVYAINEDLLERLAKTKPTTTEVFNLIRTLEEKVKGEIREKPFLLAIGERAEAIAKRFKERQIGTQEALERLKEILREVMEAEAEHRARGLDTRVFTLYWLLQKEGIDPKKAEQAAVAMNHALSDYPHWPTSEKHLRKVKEAFYKAMLKAGAKKHITQLADRILTALKTSS